MKIKIKKLNSQSIIEINNGDFIDLRASEDISFNAPYFDEKTKKMIFDYKLIPLGICVKLPKGYKMIVVPRSSTFKKMKIIQWNSCGVIDNSYCGENDEIKFPAIALEDTTIKKGDRICQFEVSLSQKANIFQKLRWLFSNKMKILFVDKLNSENRGGFGSTGVN